MAKWITFLWILLLGLPSVAQEKRSYEIPEEVATLRVNLVLLRNDDGLGGLGVDDELHQSILREAFAWVNGTLANLQPISDPACYGRGSCSPRRSAAEYEFIPNAKIRFELAEIIQIDSSKYWNNYDCQDFQDKNEGRCPDNGKYYRCPNDEQSGSWFLNPLSRQINLDPEILPAINIFFTEYAEAYLPYIVQKDCSEPRGRFHIQDCSERPNESIDKASRVHMRSKFLYYSYLFNCKTCEVEDADCKFVGTPQECCTKDKMFFNIVDGLSRVLMHELGHTVEFTSGHCSLCPQEGLMHGTRAGKNLHPAEIEHAHKTIQTSNLQRYLITDEPLIIQHKNQHWKNDMNLHRNYVLKADKELRLNNTIRILEDNELLIEAGKLIVDSNAVLILEADAKIVVAANGMLDIHKDATILFENNASIQLACGSEFNFDFHQKRMQFKSGQLEIECLDIIQQQNEKSTSRIYSLSFDLPENAVSWEVLPNSIPSVEDHNSIELFVENAVQNSPIIVRANVASPLEFLSTSTLVWLGEEEVLFQEMEWFIKLVMYQFGISYK